MLADERKPSERANVSKQKATKRNRHGCKKSRWKEREREKKKENRTREHIEKEEQETKGKFVLIQLALDL